MRRVLDAMNPPLPLWLEGHRMQAAGSLLAPAAAPALAAELALAGARSARHAHLARRLFRRDPAIIRLEVIDVGEALRAEGGDGKPAAMAAAAVDEHRRGRRAELGVPLRHLVIGDVQRARHMAGRELGGCADVHDPDPL